MTFTREQIAERARRIRGIYRAFLAAVTPLRKEQDKILRAYVAELEQKKAERIREQIGNK
jgi:hypothetical protein